MIITQLQATNILKYATLRLTDLPARGLIGVSGGNESGKTSIAEIICLALFGRTFSLPARELTKSIKWGEFHGSVNLEFTDKEGHRYSILRELDSDGNHSARLTRSDNETLIARGAQAVSQAVAEIGGWTYEQFIASLYLAQRSLILPNSLTASIKTLAGVELLETIAAELAQDINDAQAALTDLHAQREDTGTQLQALGALDDQLARLQEQRQTQVAEITKEEAESARLRSATETLRDAGARMTSSIEEIVRTGLPTTLDQWQARLDQLENAVTFTDETYATLRQNGDEKPTQELHVWVDDFRARLRAFMGVRNAAQAYYTQQSQLLDPPLETPIELSSANSLPQQEALLTQQLQSTRKSRSRALVGFWLTLLVAGVGGGLWGALTFAPESQASQWLVATLGPQLFSYLPLLPLIAGFFGLLSLIFLIRALVLSSRASSQRQKLAQVRTQMDNVRQQLQLLEPVSIQPVPTAVETLRQTSDPQLTAAVSSFTEGPGAPLVQGEVFSESLAQLQTALTAALGRLRSLQERVGTKVSDASGTIEKRRQEVRRLDQDIVAEQSRREKIESVEEQRRTLQQRIEEHQRQIAIRRTADQLLNGSHSRLYARFNLELQHVMSKILPVLTEGRYQSVLVAKDAQLQLLSLTKGDFVGMDEISGGAYHQVWLAVRLALSHALISATNDGPQFVILDEPFAFFDNTRTRLTLELLSNLSNDIAQIWVLTPHLDPDLDFTLHVRCASEDETLSASGA